MSRLPIVCIFFFFNDTSTTEIYTLSLHDALPILNQQRIAQIPDHRRPIYSSRPPRKSILYNMMRIPPNVLPRGFMAKAAAAKQDRKSTRLNSSHLVISYAVFCLKKKN